MISGRFVILAALLWCLRPQLRGLIGLCRARRRQWGAREMHSYEKVPRERAQHEQPGPVGAGERHEDDARQLLCNDAAANKSPRCATV